MSFSARVHCHALAVLRFDIRWDYSPTGGSASLVVPSTGHGVGQWLMLHSRTNQIETLEVSNSKDAKGFN